ncbi:type VII secretion protein EccCa [Pseudonocardia sp. N23]|uniref:type VII secretion protein EccCa n=1 Tax=Pseudonocardia sp. N23 TaxID=1987376 RepID=UPI000BFB9F1A|nr:type VII secretion protein EccCa [Pseudonocardia sp. N23]GAY10164.1 FtsK/SpoIIIE family protein [Pseudonocardia sp. N23]
MGTIGKPRTRRTPLPMPGGELVLEPPPELERVVPGGLLAKVLPIGMIVASIVMVVLLASSNPSMWMFGGMMALSSVAMLVSGNGGQSGAARTAGLDEDRRDYLRYLGVQRDRVVAVSAAQRAALLAVHPDPTAWADVVAAGRHWERGVSDPDFGQVRVALGVQRLATRLTAPETGPLDGIEPVTAAALRRFLGRHSVVPDLPVALDMRAGATVWLERVGADPGPARSLARAIVAQFALWHGPDAAVVAVLAADPAPWDWAKWLPHNARTGTVDALGPCRLVTSDPDELRRLLAADVAARPPGPGPAEPHVLVVVDGVEGPGPWAGAAGVTVLRVGAPPGRRAAPSVVRLAVAAGRLGRVAPDGTITPVGVPDSLDVAEAAALARRLARFRPSGAVVADDGVPVAAQDLPALLGVPGRPAAADLVAVRARWRRTPADRLRVPLGVDEHGRPLLLDLKESAQGGSGPHGLCVGATGSGKSELLRTLVLGLAATHDPADLNLVLVDFKGGPTFLGLSALPHVSAVITNLADELTLVDRMADALAGEITRRQELLRAAGNLTGVAEYAAVRAERPDLPPLPALLVVVDEFSELLAQRPELIDLMVMVGRLGRSLGLHLLLASQRLEEGRLRGLESHLSYRIALRTFSAAESRAVLGVPDAHLLPPVPGAAFLSDGTGELVRFRSSYVSGAPADVPAAGAGPARRPMLFTAATVAEPVLDDPPPDGSGPDPGVTVLDGFISAAAGLGPAAHRVWLPPLAQPPPLDELGPPTGPAPSAPWAAIGVVDRPYQQRREPLVVDLSGAAGNVVVVGGPRSGKSTALATLVLALARTHTPAELGVHAVDLGGGTLAQLGGLPHVGTVADRGDPDLVRRTVAEVAGLVARRERLFRDAGLTSVEAFRARRAAGGFADEPATDVLLVVDGVLALRTEFEDVEARLQGVAAQGLGYGVHLVVGAGRWSELRPAVKELLGTRVELRLGEPGESEVDRRRAATVPTRPGHCLAPDGAAAIVAAPWTSGRDTAALVASLADGCAAPGMPSVRTLPACVDRDDLPAGGSGRLRIGLDEDGLALVDIDPAAEPHLLCFADAESGKTALLRLLAAEIAGTHTPDQARIVVVDPRRGLLGAVGDGHLLAAPSTPDAIAAAVRDIADSLRRRLPGPAVTARELRGRSWWTGPDVWLLVDDYDLVAPTGAGAPHPLLPLAEFLPQAKDVGLHVVVARRCGGAGRALYDPVLGRLRELGSPGLVMNGSPEEGALVDTVKPAPMPPGRAMLVDRRRGARRVQLAWLAPEPDA